MPAADPRDWLCYTARALQSLLPLSTGLFYLIASAIDYVLSKSHEDKPLPLPLHNGIIGLILIVLATYGSEASLLLYEFLGKNQQPSEDRLVFALGSLLVWTTILLGLTSGTRPRSLGFPRWGCWMIYTAAESAFLFYHLTTHDRLHRCYLIFRTTRVVIFFTLCGLSTFQSPLISARFNDGTPRNDDNCPLLHHLPPGCNSGYSTISDNVSDESSDTKPFEVKNNLSKTFETLKCIAPFLWPKGNFGLQLLYLGVGLCLLADRFINILLPIQLGAITDVLTSEHVLPWRNIIFYTLLRLLDSGGGLWALRAYLWIPLENDSYKKIATAAFNQIMDLSSDFHDDKSSGKVWHAVTRGTTIRHMIRSLLFQIIPMITDLLLAVIVLHVMFGPYMGLITATVIMVFLWSSGRILALQKLRRKNWISIMEKEQNILCESTTNWKTVSYFNRIPYEKDRFSSVVDERVKSDTSFRLWTHAETAVQSLVLILGLMGACFLVAYQVSAGRKEVGSFVMLIGYWARLSSPLQFFASGFTSITIDLVDAEEFIALLKKDPSIKEKCNAKILYAPRGALRFQNVKFSYDGQRQILKGISFEAHPGQTIALVGETGSGKSTILKLLFRFYKANYGSIEIDGHDISDVTLQSLRSNIGVVPQDPALFNDTILNNIRYANLIATDEEIYKACAAVRLHHKFLSLPHGYQTNVGERGVKLSEGELQRVAIARVLIQNPRIILLDEATSSVDSETESYIQQSLSSLAAGRTIIVVAHRLSTIVDADHILALKDGNIVERGNHLELINRNGYYCRLWKKQSDGGELSLSREGNAIKTADKFLFKPEAPEFIPRWSD
ncbi:putative ABC transporter [Talaromyces proteolyticus]|uniref:ABC transporter n=1 Tax=Talaromyces proteolyticus TaxID=1131652 RepID=A0AAD4KLB3_9EURO|nr:putative ABC transporter [Talaromyces proteolyticus]KAH8695358.1 putative ABC transporter [Talaromyces proteolyticus]